MLMSYAFITTGDKLFVVPDGFDRGDERAADIKKSYCCCPLKITVPNPAQGHLTNDGDRPVIESLTRAAKSSKAFTCWRVFVKNSTESRIGFVINNVCCCCQCFGLTPLQESRTVRPGRSKVYKVVPVDDWWNTGSIGFVINYVCCCQCSLEDLRHAAEMKRRRARRLTPRVSSLAAAPTNVQMDRGARRVAPA